MSRNPKSWIIAAILVVAFAISFPAIYYRENPKPVVTRSNLASLIKQVDSSVVYIEAHDYESNQMWSGSGVIISSDGLVLTAGHMIDGADKFKVILSNGREFLSEKSYFSDVTDIGFIQIDANELSCSYLGKSSGLQKGENVFIVGCPFGYDFRFTITKGIVSGLKRNLNGFFGEKFLLQVDAQSWPGNSGGPVYNMRGQIIGILVGGIWNADGIGLCIPSDICQLVLNIYEAERELENAR